MAGKIIPHSTGVRGFPGRRRIQELHLTLSSAARGVPPSHCTSIFDAYMHGQPCIAYSQQRAPEKNIKNSLPVASSRHPEFTSQAH